MSMDIYARPGSRIVFANPRAGYEPEQQLAAEKLTVGAGYTVERTQVGGFHTTVWLVEVPGVPFNSVQFEDAPKPSPPAPPFRRVG